MSSNLIVRQAREFGDIITDPFKLIFRNIAVLFPFSMLYIFLPVAIGLGGLSYIQMELVILGNYPILITIVCVIAGFIGLLNTSTTAFALVKSAHAQGFENVDSESLKKNFFANYKRNLIFTLISSILLVGLGVLLFVFVFSSPVFGALMGFLMSLVFLFYIGPLWYLANCIYLERKEFSFSESFARARDYLSDHYVGVWGVFIVSGIIFMVLRTSFSMPFSMLYMLFVQYSTGFYPGTTINTIALLSQSTLMAFSSTFLLQFSIIAMFFKYYDLYEKEFGSNLLQRISEIGVSNESYFENEGEF